MKAMEALKKIRNYWLMVWMIAALLSFSMLATYGAYTGATQAKRVISLSGRNSMLFSSGFMYKNNSDTIPQYFSYTEGSTTSPSFIVDVCNYDQGENGVYEKDIRFKLTARLIHFNGTEIDISETVNASGYNVQYAGYTKNGTYTQANGALTPITAITLENATDLGTYTLEGNQKHRYLFNVTFPVGELVTPTYGIELRAEVLNKYNDIDSISGKLVVAQSAGEISSKWTGAFGDITADRTPADYDGINYVVSGAGTGTAKLIWNNNVLRIDESDLSNLGYSDTDNNPGEVYIDVDSENKTDRYEIRFYWVNGVDPSVAFNNSLVSLTYPATKPTNDP